MLRKLLISKGFCLAATGVAYLITIWVRFILAHETVPPGDWILWIVCNNLMIAFFGYQLGLIAATAKAGKRFQRWRREHDAVRREVQGDS